LDELVMTMGKRYGFGWMWQGFMFFCCVLSTAVMAAEGPPQVLDLTYRPAPFHAESGIEVLPKLMDSEDADVNYSCRWFVNGEEIEDLQDPLLPGEYFRRGDRIAVEVTPEREVQQGRPVRSGEIEAGNAPPRFVSRPPEKLAAGGYSYQLEAVDADQDLLTYLLLEAPTGMQLDSDNGRLTWTVEQWQPGPTTVTVVVEDGFGGRNQQEFTMNPTFIQNEGPANE
jgi:hypothetical protein